MRYSIVRVTLFYIYQRVDFSTHSPTTFSHLLIWSAFCGYRNRIYRRSITIKALSTFLLNIKNHLIRFSNNILLPKSGFSKIFLFISNHKRKLSTKFVFIMFSSNGIIRVSIFTFNKEFFAIRFFYSNTPLKTIIKHWLFVLFYFFI